ncbi:MAG: hypothetical protein JNJ83_17035 [Verrucomicrobiaceae bacterium]|nr:hypothetical protein [Verrucomicrobiaceae bacterium]
MKSLLQGLLVIISLGLCAVCVVQWTLEAKLRDHITGLNKQLVSENDARIEAERKNAEYVREIERLETLRAEANARLNEALEELSLGVCVEYGHRYALALAEGDLAAAKSETAAALKQLGSEVGNIKDFNANVQAQNEAIEKQNALLKKLAAERDDAISKLNARTKEFNELADKYNKLVR